MTEIHHEDRAPHHPFRLRDGIEVVPLRTPTLPPATHSNCVILGDDELIVVDPASPFADEQARLGGLLGARGGTVKAIWLTHHHPDHVGGVAALHQQTGAPICAHPATIARLRGTIAVQEQLLDGDRVELGELDLEVLHTPGHTRGHLAFRERRSQVVLMGDLIAGQGSIVIDPPEGDMADYLATLGRLVSDGIGAVLPAHGPAIEDGEAKCLADIAHRMAREAQLIEVLRGRVGGSARALDLVARIYPEVPVMFHPLAGRQLLAHLLKLEAEGRVDRPDGSTGVPGAPIYMSWDGGVAAPEPEFRWLGG